ncbi:unnamed protein product, partial [Ixodes pacificus]
MEVKFQRAPFRLINFNERSRHLCAARSHDTASPLRVPGVVDNAVYARGCHDGHVDGRHGRGHAHDTHGPHGTHGSRLDGPHDAHDADAQRAAVHDGRHAAGTAAAATAAAPPHGGRTPRRTAATP